MNTKKIETVDMNSLSQLQTKYGELTNTLGLITADEYSVTQQLNQIENEKTKMFEQLNSLRQEEIKLMDSLKEKYGDGQINLEEGTFTSIS